MRRGSAGFSLLELMIALAVGGIAITSIYSIGAASTRTFQQQQQVSNLQTSLRMALNQVKRDIARAGYLSTPNATGVGQSCGVVSNNLDQPGVGGSGRLAAFSAYDSGTVSGTGLDTGSFNRGIGHDYTTDDVVLFANYATSDEYPGITVIGGNQLTLDPNWHGFSRDFSLWYQNATLAVNQAALGDAFVGGRMIRIMTTQRKRHFAIIDATPVASSFSFTPALPAGCVGTGGWVAPVSAIRYYARYAANANEDVRFRNATEAMGQLIREEVNPADKRTGLTVGSPARAILDYVVKFHLFFTMTNQAGLNPGWVPVAGDYGGGINTPGIVNGNPERIRSVQIELGARSPQVEPNLPWNNSCDGTAGRPLCFQVSDKEPNAARVRILRADVLVPNVAYEDL